MTMLKKLMVDKRIMIEKIVNAGGGAHYALLWYGAEDIVDGDDATRPRYDEVIDTGDVQLRMRLESDDGRASFLASLLIGFRNDHTHTDTVQCEFDYNEHQLSGRGEVRECPDTH